ncbi:MAG: zinc-ribbon domain-containing protein [Bacilli bacterium]|nr:zinc-ribbon domain-containing protein [Bacilli bacterium]
MAKFCINCGKELGDTDKVCSQCGTPVDGAAPAQATTVVAPARAQKSNGLALAGFIVSLVSTILCCGSFNVISLILSIVGAVKAKDCGGNGKGLAIAGIIISAIGLILLIVLTIFGYAAAIIEEAGYSY